MIIEDDVNKDTATNVGSAGVNVDVSASTSTGAIVGSVESQPSTASANDNDDDDDAYQRYKLFWELQVALYLLTM